MTLRVRIEGLREIKAALAELPKATSRNVMKRILTARIKPIVDAAKGLAPSDSGFLGESIRIRTAPGGNAGKAAFAEAMRAGATRKEAGAAARAANAATAKTAEVFAGPRAGPREIAAEYGTKYRQPTPFMRPAWDAAKDGLLTNIGDDIWREISKAVARRAKRAAKKSGM